MKAAIRPAGNAYTAQGGPATSIPLMAALSILMPRARVHDQRNPKRCSTCGLSGTDKAMCTRLHKARAALLSVSHQHMHNNTQTCSGTYTHQLARARTQACSARMNTQAATQLRARCVNSTRRMPSCICKRFCHALVHTNGEADGCSRRWR